jgi:hypothetical protein
MNDKNNDNRANQTITVSRGIFIVVGFVMGVLILMGGIAFFFLVLMANRGGENEDTRPLTRAEFVMKVVAVLETPTARSAVFEDVPVSDMYNPYITAAVGRGILRPLEAGLVLNADAPIPPAEAVELVVRALGAGAAGEAMLRRQLTGSWFGNETTRQQANMLIDGMKYTLAEFSAAQDTEYTVEYHTHVQVIKNPPLYNHTESEGYFTIIVYIADDYIRALAPGDTFVFEPTEENPGGISGHVTDVYHVVGGAVITARQPRVLSEIFIQYRQGAAFYILNDMAEVVAADNIPVTKDDNTVRVQFNNRAFPSGVTVNGEISISNPRVYASFALTHVEYLTAAMEAAFDTLSVSRSADTEEDVFIELFTVYSAYSGVWMEFAAGLHILSDGEFMLEISANFNGAFGIRDGRVSMRTRADYTFEYARRYTRAGLALGAEVRGRVLGIPVYGIGGVYGRGFTATQELQEQCHAGVCFVVGIFDIRQVHSLTEWGALRNAAALRFGEDFAYDGLYDTWYIYRGAFRRFSTHPENFEVVSP